MFGVSNLGFQLLDLSLQFLRSIFSGPQAKSEFVGHRLSALTVFPGHIGGLLQQRHDRPAGPINGVGFAR